MQVSWIWSHYIATYANSDSFETLFKIYIIIGPNPAHCINSQGHDLFTFDLVQTDLNIWYNYSSLFNCAQELGITTRV